jgi:predicted GTPase
MIDASQGIRELIDTVHQLRDRIKALEAENSRLRGLVAYLAGENEDHVRVALAGNPNVVAEIMDRARAALIGGSG